MKTDSLERDLFVEAEEALRELMATQHRGRLPISPSDVVSDQSKLSYLQKLAERASLVSECEHHLAKILVAKMDRRACTRMTLEDYAQAVLNAVAEQVTAAAKSES